MNAITKLREREDLSQSELATHLGITQGMVSKLENGKLKPNSAILQKLYEKWGITPNDLLLSPFTSQVSPEAEQVSNGNIGPNSVTPAEEELTNGPA